jgi:hypothetical protein
VSLLRRGVVVDVLPVSFAVSRRAAIWDLRAKRSEETRG